MKTRGDIQEIFRDTKDSGPTNTQSGSEKITFNTEAPLISPPSTPWSAHCTLYKTIFRSGLEIDWQWSVTAPLGGREFLRTSAGGRSSVITGFNEWKIASESSLGSKIIISIVRISGTPPRDLNSRKTNLLTEGHFLSMSASEAAPLTIKSNAEIQSIVSKLVSSKASTNSFRSPMSTRGLFNSADKGYPQNPHYELHGVIDNDAFRYRMKSGTVAADRKSLDGVLEARFYIPKKDKNVAAFGFSMKGTIVFGEWKAIVADEASGNDRDESAVLLIRITPTGDPQPIANIPEAISKNPAKILRHYAARPDAMRMIDQQVVTEVQDPDLFTDSPDPASLITNETFRLAGLPPGDWSINWMALDCYFKVWGDQEIQRRFKELMGDRVKEISASDKR